MRQPGGTPIDDDATRVLADPAAARAGAPAHGHAPGPDPDPDPDRTVIRPQAHAPRPATVPTPAASAPSTPPAAAARHTAPALALPVGFRLHEYRIDGVIGQGGFGITYLATDVNLNARVAIKEYLPQEIAFRRSERTVSAHSTRHRERYQRGLDSFLVEARTLATFRHPQIVRVARFFEAHQTAYMVLEYERGQSLKAWWPAQKKLREHELVQLLQPLLDGLGVVHGAGFLHRDIKPDNIRVRHSDGTLVLLDFGSAAQAVAASSEAEVAVTPGYAPPEQYDGGEQGPWTDIYGLGATLYWMLTGRKPPDAQERAQAVALGQPDPLQPVAQAALGPSGRWSPALLAGVDHALALDPQQRPRSLSAWSAELFRAHAAGLGLQAALNAGEAGEARESGFDGAGPDAHARLQARAQAQAASLRLRLHRRLGRWRTIARDVVSPSAWPLAWKMTLAMIGTALLPMLITAYYNLRVNVQAASTAELTGLAQLARSTAGRVAQLLGDSRNLARSLASDSAFVGYLAAPDEAGSAAMQAKLDALLQANPDIDLMMVMDAAGNALVATDPKVTGRNFAFREYFRAASQGRPYASGIIVGSVTGAAGIFHAQPVFDDARHVIGVMVLRIRASAVAAILRETQTDPDLVPMLVDGDGVVVLHPDPRVLYSSLAPLPPEKLAAIRADQRFKRDDVPSLGMPVLAQALTGAGTGSGHVEYRSTLTQRDEIAGYAPVGGHDWVVAVSESRASFEAPLHDLFLHVVVSVGLVGLLFLGLALMFARSIVEPIRALTRAAHALKNGDYDAATVAVRSRDEIGRLARTFNVMIDVLRQRERERERQRRRG